MSLKSTLFVAFAFIFTGVTNFASAETFNGPTVLRDQNFDDLTINGPADLKNIRAKNLTVNGPLKFHRIEITGNMATKGATIGLEGKLSKVSVRGPFKARKVRMESLDVHGPVMLSRFTNTGDTVIKGPLRAKHGHFQDLTAGSDQGGTSVHLYSVTANNVTVNKGEDPEILDLGGQTEISGKITFKSGRGEIKTAGNDVKIQAQPVLK